MEFYDENEKHLEKSIKYKIFFENETYTCKELNKCNEFINSEIHDWIKKNGLDKYRERNPPKFCVHMINSETIVIIGQIQPIYIKNDIQLILTTSNEFFPENNLIA